MRNFFTCLMLLLAIAAAPDLNDTEVFFKLEQEAEVPIIMYHLVTERQKYIGKYGITPQELERDLEYLNENGYTPIHIKDLIGFVERDERLPNKPIILTFDDGNSGDYKYVLPLMQQYKMKAVLSIMGEQTDKYTKDEAENPGALYPNLTWAQVTELHKSGLMEIQSHGYNVHGKAGSGKKSGESPDAYHQRLLADLKKLQDACETHLGYTPTAFTYPLGIMSEGSREVIEKLGMSASLSCQEGINIIRRGDKDCLFKLKRYNRPSGKSIKQILEKL